MTRKHLAQLNETGGLDSCDLCLKPPGNKCIMSDKPPVSMEDHDRHGHRMLITKSAPPKQSRGLGHVTVSEIRERNAKR